MSVRKKISVIILMHNKAVMTLSCLEALAPALADLDHEVILRDNGSTENIDYLRGCDEMFQGYQFIRGEENLSFSIANNLIVREASGDFFLFLNNDVFCRPDTIRNLLQPLIEDNSIGSTGGKLLYPEEKSVQSAGLVQLLGSSPTIYAIGARPDDRRIQNMCERFALMGAMLCVPSEIFHSVGGFDERYFWGYEDVDLCLKIKATGKKIIYCPDAVAVHCDSATLKPSRSAESDERNYRVYRQTWDSILVPAEQRYIQSMKDQGIQRVVVFGMGIVAGGMSKTLDENGIEIAAFTASSLEQPGVFLNRPAVPLAMLNQMRYDRIMVASQYFFEIEPTAQEHDPQGSPIYPLLYPVWNTYNHTSFQGE